MKRLMVVVFLLILGAAIWWSTFPPAPVEFVVGHGASAREVAYNLKRAKLIVSPKVFLYALRFSGNINKLKAGVYDISPRLSFLVIMKLLIEGRVKAIKVTIPEGFNARQIAERLERMGITDAGRFLDVVDKQKLEGYLYPETYYFELGTPAENVAGAMAREFRRRFTEDMVKRAQELKMNEHKVVTLASIIEKEAAKPEERPLVSSVFHNRLKKRWYLESCATVVYALGEHKPRLLLKDLKINSPYNTYRNYGLPPGPICNPGIESIKAALYPADTDNMFFVVQDSGTHNFSRYFKEHLENKKTRKKRK